MFLTSLPVARAFNDTLDGYLQRSGVSYNQLAQLADMDPAYVYRLCKGDRRGARDALIRLCIALGLSVDDMDVVLRSRNFPELSGRRRAPVPLPNA